MTYPIYYFSRFLCWEFIFVLLQIVFIAIIYSTILFFSKPNSYSFDDYIKLAINLVFNFKFQLLLIAIQFFAIKQALHKVFFKKYKKFELKHKLDIINWKSVTVVCLLIKSADFIFGMLVSIASRALGNLFEIQLTILLNIVLLYIQFIIIKRFVESNAKIVNVKE